MSRLNDEVISSAYAIAERAIQQYAQGLLTVKTLTAQILDEVNEQWVDENGSSQRMLIRIAQRLCSRVLHDAWRSSDTERRNQAFRNLRRYLEWSLLHSSYARRLQSYTYAVEDVLHTTLEILSIPATQKNARGPDDPAAFLKWTQTILIRQAYTFFERAAHEAYLSLDEQAELFAEQFVDTRNGDPLEKVLVQELQQALVDALLSLRNPRYRQVLLATYLMDLDEREVAHRLDVEVQDVYLWRHRAIRALRQQPTILQSLRDLCD